MSPMPWDVLDNSCIILNSHASLEILYSWWFPGYSSKYDSHGIFLTILRSWKPWVFLKGMRIMRAIRAMGYCIPRIMQVMGSWESPNIPDNNWSPGSHGIMRYSWHPWESSRVLRSWHIPDIPGCHESRGYSWHPWELRVRVLNNPGGMEVFISWKSSES